MRPRYLAAHIHRVWKAVNIGTPIRGYYHWSLVDNFEWERGWTQRFGLWGLDPETQARSRRPSVDFYAEICKANALSSDMVAALRAGSPRAIVPLARSGRAGDPAWLKVESCGRDGPAFLGRRVRRLGTAAALLALAIVLPLPSSPQAELPPFRLPFAEPPGPDTWLLGQLYGNTIFAYRARAVDLLGGAGNPLWRRLRRSLRHARCWPSGMARS